MDLLGIGGIIEGLGKVAGDLITTDKERMTLELEGRKLDQTLDLAQMDVNKAEAANQNWFVAGWRPYVGWVCGSGLAYVAILEPVARFVAKVFFSYDGAFPVIDTDLTMQVLVGMLGLGALRTTEKVKDVARS